MGGELLRLLCEHLLLSGVSGLEYKPASAFSEPEDAISERDVLLTRKRKHETAMNRLKSLYLYGDSDMPEKDFIIECQRIQSAIDEIDEKLSSIKTDEDDRPLVGDEFIEKASYFIMMQKLMDDRTVDYEKYIRQTKQSVPRAFIRSIITSITVNDGKVISIEFKNGMIHTFTYKQE